MGPASTNFFIEQILPKAMPAHHSAEEMRQREYRRPFADPGEGDGPTLTWQRRFQSRGDRDVVAIATAYAEAGESRVPRCS